MNTEYGIEKKSVIKRIEEYGLSLIKDYRSSESIECFENLFENMDESSVCLSIGGGPQRPHPYLTNINIAPFQNVDMVADAHHLPYSDNSVDVIYSEAVLEHLASPDKAVKEMFRVLKPGGKAFVITPFLQAYHGYPHHYQNFTLQGHENLFFENGFTINKAGVCVGPIYTIFNLLSKFIKHYFWPVFALPILVILNLLSLFFRPLDNLLNKKEEAHVLASTTFVSAVKP